MHALDGTYIKRDSLLGRDRDSLSDKTDTEKKEPFKSPYIREASDANLR